MGRVASCWAVVALCMALLTAMSGCGGAESKPGMETQCTAGEACDDENPCTENDKCTGQGECIGELISCDDSRECTVDSCDPSGQCVHDLKPGFCLINGVCVADGETKPDTPCAECMVAASKTEWMNDDTNECGLEDKCHTGSHCSDGECILGTEALDCDDDNLCTDDSCDPAKGCQNVPNSSPCEHGTCTDGECQCTPDCEGKECGPDGCGSDCGTCDEGCECSLPTGTCIGDDCGPCIPDCGGKECGDDGCGGSCGQCKAEDLCLDGKCMGFVVVPAGIFTMGTPDGTGAAPAEKCRVSNEGPQHDVTFSHDLLVKTTEVTQAEWEAVMGGNPSAFTGCGPECPVENISWTKAAEFCNKLSEMAGLGACYVFDGEEVTWPGGYDCNGYRLPTEAEWEYFARAGTDTAFYSGDIGDCKCGANPGLEQIGWYCGNSQVDYVGCSDQSSWGGDACVGTHPVAKKQPNAWGLHDVAGNVWEPCWDWLQNNYYASSPSLDPAGPPSGTYRVSRGGSWYAGGASGYGADSCRSGARHALTPGGASSALGIRPVRSGACVPQCADKECGDDGCGGSCGECPDLVCGSVTCPDLEGYAASCNPNQFCEYANLDNTGWKKWDVWLWIPPGSFDMGSPDEEEGHVAAESPVHTVVIGTGFLVGKYEAVVLQYEACMAAGECSQPSTTDWDGEGWGTNSSAAGRPAHPQNGITFEQSKEFCAWLAAGGRLPTEAEWEYAATGPVHQVYPWGDSPEPTCSNDTAVFSEGGDAQGYGCGAGGTWEVGSKPLGAAWCGAMDMAGNVREWVQDDYHPDYVGAPTDGAAWTAGGVPSPVVRGGNFANVAGWLRSAARGNCSYLYKAAYMGVRCVRPASCDPDCAGKECGDDGCGGACGSCGDGAICYVGECVPSFQLPDTGQTECYNTAGKIPCPLPGAPFYGQDGNYSGPAYVLQKKGDGTVADLATGLTWAKCHGGQTPPNCFGQALKVNWQDAVDHCAQNMDGLSGSGWRLASRNELLSIMSVAESGCLLSDYFVSVPDAVWTGTEYPYDPQKFAYAISFGTCSAGAGWDKEEQLAYFRCVRGAPLTFGKFVVNNDSTVSDLSTSLMWQEKDDGQERNWEQALAYCESLVLAGKADWRLPNAREIMTLMDYTLPNASIYEGVFPGAGQQNYWTGSTLACCPDAAYGVHFSAAFGYGDHKKTMPMNVRCVR